MYLNGLRELESMGDEIAAFNPDFGQTKFNMRVSHRPAEEVLARKRWKTSLSSRTHAALILEADPSQLVEVIRSKSKLTPGAFTDAQLNHQFLKATVTHFEMEVSLLFLILSIVRPGSIATTSGFAFADGEEIGRLQPFHAHDLFFAVEVSASLGWPMFPNPPLASGWNWLLASAAVEDGVGIGHLGRALSAVSHLTRGEASQSSQIDLVWVLLGLEALYSRGNVGLKEQLLGKSEALLGSRFENKKAFSGVYDYRSRLLHGDVDIPLRFSPFDGAKKFEDFQSKLFRSEDIASATLICTLQEMIASNRYSIEFEYAMKVHSAPPVPPNP